MFRTAKTRFSRALLTLTVALLPVFSGISGGLHLMLVRHVVCRAHGELVHADANCAAELAVADEPRSRNDTPAPGWQPDVSGGEKSDEHCQVVLLSRATFDLWQARESQAQVSQVRLQLAPRERAPRECSIAQILLAPKQSPPA